MSSAICFNLNQSRILLSGNGLKKLKESMSRSSGGHTITEIMLKTFYTP